MKTREAQPAITRGDLAFCLLVEAGATLAEAWDYAPRVAADRRPLWDRTAADLCLDLAMWRRSRHN